MTISRFFRWSTSDVSRRHRRVQAQVRPIESLEGRVLLHAGDRDPSFGFAGTFTGGFAGYDEADTMIDVANGRVVIGRTLGRRVDYNTFEPSRIGLIVLDGSGNPIKSFSDDGYKTQALSVNGHLLDMLVQPDNKILVLVGNDTGPRVLARFNADGSLDSGFGQKTITLADANNIARVPGNGDVLVAGDDSAGHIALARYAATGASKSGLVTSVTGGVEDIAVQADGKPVIVAHVAGAEFPNEKSDVIRIKSDLTGLDSTFDGDGRVTLSQGAAYDVEYGFGDGGEIEIDAQGRIVVAVTPDTDGSEIYRLLPASGALDPSFTVTNVLPSVWDLAISSNGKITASGHDFANGESVVRLNANGGVDTTYGTRGYLYTDDAYYDVHSAGNRHDVQPDGRVVTAFSDGTIFRLTADDATPVGTAVLGSDGVLRVTGTAGNDHVALRDSGADGGIQLELNGQQFRYDSGVSRIDISTLGGNDHVDGDGLFYIPFPDDTSTQRPRTIHGGAGNDLLSGNGGKDTIAGEDGNDIIYANGGDDVIIDGPGTDLNDGGLGADTVDYSFRSGPVYVDLQGDADDGPAGERDTVATSIEQIIGSKGNDTLVGDGRPNYIDGRGGNDTIYGGGGNDTLVGGLGQDKLYGQDGNDFLDAKDGITDLVLDGGAGTDTARKDNSDPRVSIEVLFNG